MRSSRKKRSGRRTGRTILSATSPGLRLAAQLLLIGAIAQLGPSAAASKRSPLARFFAMGDGRIALRSTHNKHRFRGRYRDAKGNYRRRALRRINAVFGARYGDPDARISLRLIEALSFLRAKLHGGWITISSGYRSPRYNRKLRAKGRTVAKASLHQYGMAADISIQKVPAKKLWMAVRRHGLGGAGFYGSRWVHIDVGPARWWTQGTANVHKGISNHNKRIILVPRFDIYAIGERMRLRFARMTAYPIGVQPTFVLQRKRGDQWKSVGELPLNARTAKRSGTAKRAKCSRFSDMAAMTGLAVALPAELAPGRYRLRVRFCDNKWEAMPEEIGSYVFAVRR